MRPPAARRRRSSSILLLALALVGLVAAACGSGGASSPPSTSPLASPSPDSGAGFRLRATTVQALPPLSIFAWTPLLVITDDLVAIQSGPMIELYPGPLVTPLVGSQLTGDAWDVLVDEARTAGLLGGASDFTGGTMAMGAPAGNLELIVDGRTFDLTGDPSRLVRCGEQRCIPDPGTPEAFAALWSSLTDLPRRLGGAVPLEWTPGSFALLVGPPRAEDPQLSQPILPWPLDGPSSEFGDPVTSDPTLRCGVVTGDEAVSLAIALRSANQLTRWRDPLAPDVPEALLGLTVRPLLPGDDDPCAPLVAG